jgi:RNA polymerase II C-terminal domain phosphatase-like 3/4
LRKLEADRLRATKRLVLVLDLDHTLLNSVRLSEVTPEHDRMLHGILEAEADKPHKLLHCLR